MSHGGSADQGGVQVDRHGLFRGSVPKATIPPGPGPGGKGGVIAIVDGGGVIAKNGTDNVKIIMIKIRDVPDKTGLLATLSNSVHQGHGENVTFVLSDQLITAITPSYFCPDNKATYYIYTS